MIKLLKLTFLTLFIVACNSEPEIAGVGSFGTGIAESNGNSSCVSQTVDTGNKGNIAAGSRGTFSDTQIIPNSTNPAVAYVDTWGLSIKLSYYNSGWNQEVVSGDLGATFIGLEFLSNGRPLVFWTNGGTTVKMASRSAALGSSGTWTTYILDTFAGGATRTLDVAVNPDDEIAVIYMSTNTTATARPRFIYCSSSCADGANYSVMSATENIEATGAYNLTIAQVATGVAWCGVDTNADSAVDDYYPAVTYGGQANSNRYAVCAQSNLANCLVNTAWSKQNYVAAVSNLAQKLIIDHNLVNDTPKIAALKAGTGVRTFIAASGCSAVSAFTESNQTIGGATIGNAWLNALKTSDGRFHIVANTTTTSLSYYNTTGTNFISSVANPTQWNSVGTINTTTLAAASATTGGSAVIASTGQIVTSYYQAVNTFNLMLGTIQDYTVASGSAVLTNQYINNSGGIQLTTAQTRNVSVGATSDGRPGIAYIDNSATTAATARLKYAFRDSTSNTVNYDVLVVPHLGTTPMFPSLAYDHNNKPWIAYFDSNSTAASSKFYLVTNTSSDGTGTWTTYQFPIASLTGTYALGATNDTALVMYKSGGVSYPVMVVIDNNNASQGVKVSKLTPSTGVWSTLTTIDALGATDGSWLSADSDSSGNIVVAYQSLTAPVGVYYSYSSNGGTTWTTPKQVSVVATAGQAVSIKINPATSKPWISYFDRASNSAYYAYCSGTFSSCATSGWTNDDIETAAGVSALTAATTDQLLGSSLTFNSAGTATILYPLGMGTAVGIAEAGHLKRVDIVGAGGTETKSTFTSGLGASSNIALNYGVNGWNVRSVRTSTGELVSAFVGAGNYLYSKSCPE